MGISIDLWRLRIGSLCQKVHYSDKDSGSCYKVIRLDYSVLSSCIIAFLLPCAGIEPNPGPTVAEFARKLD